MSLDESQRVWLSLNESHWDFLSVQMSLQVSKYINIPSRIAIKANFISPILNFDPFWCGIRISKVLDMGHFQIFNLCILVILTLMDNLWTIRCRARPMIDKIRSIFEGIFKLYRLTNHILLNMLYSF